MTSVHDLPPDLEHLGRRRKPAFPSRPVPMKALWLSAGALAIPGTASLAAPDWIGQDVGVLVWMAALVPVFLLTFYKGWRGSLVALSAGMTVLSVTQVGLVLVDAQDPNWSFLPGVVAVFVGVSLGLGCFAELLHRERVVGPSVSNDGPTAFPIRDAELTGGIAHDVNNILAAILTNAQLLAMALPPDWAEEGSELRDIENAARRGADLIKRLTAQDSTPAVS